MLAETLFVAFLVASVYVPFLYAVTSPTSRELRSIDRALRWQKMPRLKG